ncbi:barstar family protein [Paenibacillus mucilaginosus]|uniref:Barstar-like protein ribonuclease inhibitor n=2 Tax=Paenibacillus mucilaginosus TaxID=61624 RepID=H6NFW8_9BACL|nr:barstar family protein [Paenibacillus mucilaginosus]AEI43774.1 barstar-like protein ribonuclease (barnase) inhibitor [Paenibacillus mucilaginosus KNP414]AFC31387.1 barstar-like protein ribonuclease inhibitor [Paenibacillus mucilaginosus 3016]MCG7212704.1 barstar family protein [Paenibacillus mucilaginosus]WDM25277.1 barstar family protein [Paenibacillus mucilaginosus]WFA19940.1 barnase inhibitor [Paenibacillus mucilaginosus]
MRSVTLDGTRMATKEELHRELKEKLGLPEHYGNNLDALWDCLTGEVELPLEIDWKHYGAAVQALGPYGESTAELFEEAVRQLDGSFRFTKDA